MGETGVKNKEEKDAREKCKMYCFVEFPVECGRRR